MGKTLSIKALIEARLQDNESRQAQRHPLGQGDLTTMTKTACLKADNKNDCELIRQELDGEQKSQFIPTDLLYKGVPADAIVLFPSIRHDPDLRGYGVESNTLPLYIQLFGYWGYRLKLGRGGMCWPVPAVKNPPRDDHVRYWLYYCYDECIREHKEWEACNNGE